MKEFKLIEGLFLYPTPAGAYQAVSTRETDKPRRFLRSLLQLEKTPKLDIEHLRRLSEFEDAHKALELLHHCQNLGWVQGTEELIEAPLGSLETILPDLLGKITEKGKVLLADDQGFFLASSGFPHEVAEELAALIADLASVHNRRSGLLTNNMGINSHAWAVVDAFGNSLIGFWPVFVGERRFIIAISGVPHFNQAEFVSLVWALSRHYVKKKIPQENEYSGKL